MRKKRIKGWRKDIKQGKEKGKKSGVGINGGHLEGKDGKRI